MLPFRRRAVFSTEPGAGGGGGVTDHGDLTGLADDDHTHYVHNSSARTITAQHAFNYAGAPFTLGVNSAGNKVTDFNSDLLDGLDSAAFALASHTHSASDITSGTLALARGGTGASLSATGPGYLKQASSGATVTVAYPTVAEIASGVLQENVYVGLDESLSADGKYTGIVVDGTAGATLAFGDLCYLAASDSRWELADADAASTSGDVLLGVCVLAAAADGNATRMLLYGTIRADAAFPTLTIGAPVYVSTTAGDVQVAQPSDTDDVIRVVGFALTADSMLFNPSPDYITHV